MYTETWSDHAQLLRSSTETLKDVLLNLTQSIDRDRYMISSAEAKIQRVEPGSEEFEDTVRLIERTKRSLQDKAHARTVVKLELYRRTYAGE